jgi:acyl-coenzyme A synthetase/AMP-(fatty) acid ligase
MAKPVHDGESATRALQDHVKHKLVPYKYPRLIAFLPELPKTGTGKVDRQALLRDAVAPKRVGSAANRGLARLQAAQPLVAGRQGGAA